MNQAALSRLALFCLALSAGGHALAAGPTPAPTAVACPCAGANAGLPPATADHSINTKGTGANNGITARASPAQKAAPAASGAGGTTKKPGHVTINR